MAKRDYKKEYKDFQGSEKQKKYRAELNKYNRDKGTYGNGDKLDASHKKGKIVGFEKQSTNRARKDKATGLNKTYVPDSLTKKDKAKQVKSIKEQSDRPKLDSFISKRSSWAEKFEKKYGYKISNKSRVQKEIISKTGYDKIIAKGMGAYYSSGSRPNQTPFSWSLARLASVIMGGNARKVDADIWNKYKK